MWLYLASMQSAHLDTSPQAQSCQTKMLSTHALHAMHAEGNTNLHPTKARAITYSLYVASE